MAELPWFKFWAADFLAHNDVRAMSAEQVGWYCLMLIGSWNNTPRGYITTDEQVLSACCHCVDPLYFNSRSGIVLRQFQKTEDGLWYYHSKIIEQALERAQLSEKKSIAGKVSAAKRAINKPNTRSTPVQQVINESESESDKKNRAKRATSFPDGYQPKQSHKDFAISLGINLRESFPAFRDYHQSKGNTFKDWDAALRTWLRNERKFDKTSPTKRPADIPTHATVSCDQCSDQFPVEHIGRHMTKNPVRQFCSEKCLNEYQGRLVSA
jgi:uncharacterized protein YdaU (DUF1376 family)